MQIVVRGRNLQVTDEHRELVERRFAKVAKQVSEAATLEVELCEERTRSDPNDCVAEATLILKGTTLRAKDSSRDIAHAINLIAEDMAVQVKRHRDKRRGRRESRAAAAAPPMGPGAVSPEGAPPV